MIDDYTKVQALMQAMEVQLPIPVMPSNALACLMQENDVRIDPNQELFIKRVFYLGDGGGISCDVTPAGMEKEPIVCSITQVVIRANHPLAQEIRAYQRERKRKLALFGGGGPATFSITPNKNRRKGRK